MKKNNKEVTSSTIETHTTTSNLWKPIILLTIIIALFTAASLFGFGDQLRDLKGWIQSLGLWGPLAFFLVYLGVTIAAIPATVLGVIAGAIFGSFLGVIIVSIASTIGAGLTFLLARYFARDAVVRWLTTNQTFQKLDQLTEKQGVLIVAITRLIPLFPFNILNYGFGLTKIPFRTYLFWSWLCMLPGTIVFVVGADAITQGITEGKIPWLLIGIVASVILLLIAIAWYTRRNWQEKEKIDEEMKK